MVRSQYGQLAQLQAGKHPSVQDVPTPVLGTTALRDVPHATLPKLVLRFSWIRLAYPQFRQQLKDAIVTMSREQETKKAGFVHLKNLEFMCEWCIPLVLYA